MKPISPVSHGVLSLVASTQSNLRHTSVSIGKGKLLVCTNILATASEERLDLFTYETGDWLAVSA